MYSFLFYPEIIWDYDLISLAKVVTIMFSRAYRTLVMTGLCEDVIPFLNLRPDQKKKPKTKTPHKTHL